MELKPWTVGLLILIIVDSIVTSYIGTETNPLILWTMETFNLTLNQAMVARIFYCLPLVAIINYADFGKLTVICYIGLYLIFSIKGVMA